MKKFLVTAALSLTLTASTALTSFASGFVTTPEGVKYQ